MTRMLWMVTNEWQGFGREGAIVEADTQAEALVAAKLALTDYYNALRAVYPAEVVDGHIDSYASGSMRWLITPINLPHVGEYHP